MLYYFYLQSAESLNLWKNNCLVGFTKVLLENKLTLFLKYPIHLYMHPQKKVNEAKHSKESFAHFCVLKISCCVNII